MTHEMTTGEMLESLTGFDELAIQKAFGNPITEWMPDEDTKYRGEPMKTVRALAFIAERREGKKDAEAYKAAMELTIAQVQDYFAPDSEDDPESEPGKGD